jgi:NAD(P)-dependent dehydrogenase (short-subunit alcohol dehydrogenase family)
MRALVTGASSGLGRALCSELTDVYGWTVDGVAENPGPHVTYPVDLADPAEIDDELPIGISDLSLLVNCAGVNHLAPFHELSIEACQRLMDVNCWAGVRLVQRYLQELSANNGTVINIISNAAHVPMTHSLAYNVSKAAQEMATRQMAHELTKTGVTVFGVSPIKMQGTTMSYYIDKAVPEMRGWTEQEAQEYQRKAILTGEELRPSEVADFICKLVINQCPDHISNTGYVRAASMSNHSYLAGCIIPVGV